MTAGQIANTLWKRRWLFSLALALFMGMVLVATLSLPKTYRATATLYVGATEEVNEALAYDTNVGEQLTRTYATLSGNPNVADAVIGRLPFPMTRNELLARMSFAPVQRTQLLTLAAEGPTAQRAQTLANTYAEVFVERVNREAQRGDAPTTIDLAEPAALPDKPAKPNPPLYLGLGFIIATFLALGTVLLRDRLDNRIRVAEDDTEILGQPIVGRVPTLSRRRTETSTEVADSFRLLRTNITFLAMSRPVVLAVTSGSPGEGKSTMCANLATTAAADGERVVVLEADLRRPGLRNTMLGRDVDLPKRGLTNFLVGANDLDEIIFEHPRIPGLDVIFSGPLPPNPAALLDSGAMRSLIDELRGRYDRVVLDTSPISVGADATLLLHLADGTLYVIDARRTRASHALAGLNQLETANARLLGVVLNRSELVSVSSYGYYGERPEPTRV